MQNIDTQNSFEAELRPRVRNVIDNASTSSRRRSVHRLGCAAGAAMALVSLGGCTGGGPTYVAARPRHPTSWERTKRLDGTPEIESSIDGSMTWSLTRSWEDGRKVCWTPKIVEGPAVLRSITDLGEFCTGSLDGSAAVVQFPFVQPADTMFAQQDGFQSIAGVVDDRLDQGRFTSTDGRDVQVRVNRDGTFISRLPMDFKVQSVVFEGGTLRVVCEGGRLEFLDTGKCSVKPKG